MHGQQNIKKKIYIYSVLWTNGIMQNIFNLGLSLSLCLLPMVSTGKRCVVGTREFQYAFEERTIFVSAEGLAKIP